MYLFLVFANFFLWSSSFTIGKITLSVAAPLYATGTRLFAAGLILAIFRRWKTGHFMLISREALPALILLTLSGFYLTNVCEIYSLKHLSAGRACFIYSLSPFIAAVASYIQLKEKITSKRLLGIGIGLAGYLPLLLKDIFSSSGLQYLGLSELILLIGVIVANYGWTLMRKTSLKHNLTSQDMNAFCMIFAGFLALSHSLCVETWSPTPCMNSWAFIKITALAILISNLICHNLFGWLLKRFSSTFLSFCGLGMPLFSAFFGKLFLGESISGFFIFSTFLTLLGCHLVYFDELKITSILNSPSSNKY
ncbi:S-adenosylmethionine/S-adenosylhomocysteine transporter [Candidatus Clavichlamydia salmonicola]|uniref:DMT family transporter n=1 Tax=Candidatus Clavichlamydia salmonicola TaxID=469812 RepID=UPI0018912A55|nr:DMT family transporter [Candidatus Clavichlamydia salmonicola]MBF5050585.1 S-adenosylmethionine/S-adenosylhomocysteine transporter [Candidatus Clavichlamydia salmonicola]